MMKNSIRVLLTCILLATFCVSAHADWQGPYKIATVQSNEDGNTFIQIQNLDGSIGQNMISVVSPGTASAARDILLQAHLNNKKVKLHINGALTGSGWPTFNLVQIGDYPGQTVIQ